MRTEIIRIYKTVHTWTGIVTGLALFIAFYAGAITMFKEPLAHWIAPPPQHRASLAQTDLLIHQTLAVRPDAAKEFTLHLTDYGNVPARLTWQKSRDDNSPWSADFAPDGSLQIQQLHRSGLPRFIDDIHRTAGIPSGGEIGEKIMGIVSILYAVTLVSGVIVLLPSLVKDLFALRLGVNLKRMWLDAHNVVGIVSLPFHLIMALTAVIFGLHDLIYELQDRWIYDGQLRPIIQASIPGSVIKRDDRPAPMLAPEELLARVRQRAPDFEPVAMQYRNAGAQGAYVRIVGHNPRYLARGMGFVVLSPVSGDILSTDYLPGHQGFWSASVSPFFALHFGSYGGEPVRWAYFFLGLAGAFLFYSGNLLWIETRRRTDRRHRGPAPQRLATRLMAAGTVGVCLGCICGISLTIAAAKWLHGRVGDIDAWHQAIYYATFLGVIAWAFQRGAARAAGELLWFAAAAAAAIPMTTLVTTLFTDLGATTLGVDIVAAVGSLGLVWMARANRRRAIQGPQQSVWSLASASASSRSPYLSEEPSGALEISGGEESCDRIGPSQ